MVFSIRYLLCFFQLILLHQLLAKAQTDRNITLGSTLSTIGNNLAWVSPSGDFAFGFRPMGGNAFLLAIWFDKIPEKTIVWSANGGKTVQQGSKVELTNTGQLLLNDPRGNAIWKPDVSRSGVAYAAMLDTGNFVLANGSSVNIWETFSNPNDTMLPTQIHMPGTVLASRLAEANYARGRFQLRLLNDNGALELHMVTYGNTDVDDLIWSNIPTSNDTGAQLVFDQLGEIYLVRTNGSRIMSLSSADTFPTNKFYHRATLDYDGVFRHYWYPKDTQTNNTGWSNSWSTILPPNICETGGVTGGGPCGYNAYCRIGDNRRPVCECPPRFAYLDPNNRFGGCKMDFLPQNCDKDSKEDSLFDFQEMNGTDWGAYESEYYEGVQEDYCRQACMSDCNCPVAVFTPKPENTTIGKCVFKRFPLSNGWMNVSMPAKALIKVRKDNSGGKPLIKLRRDSSSNLAGVCLKKRDKSNVLIIVSVLLGISCCLTLVISLFLFLSFRNQSKKNLGDQITPGINLQNFTYKELENATNGFKEEIGSGAFATVYKGVLGSNGKTLLAVKKLELVSESGEEFRTEVNAIGRTYHTNLVQLLGFCNEGSHRILVYEFMSNGTLANFLFANPRPNWFQRTRIALGIATGLTYLHEECNIQIIHCDIKPQNILLDDSFTARVSDFGLAKLLKTDQSQTSTGIRGTRGYQAPEWFGNMGITTKVDVYSFGVMLLEIICCRRNVESNHEDEYKVILTDWAYNCYKEERLDLLLKGDEDAMGDMKNVEKLVMIAIWCIQEEPSLRPTMKRVTQMMEGDVLVSPPPDPSSIITNSLNSFQRTFACFESTQTTKIIGTVLMESVVDLQSLIWLVAVGRCSVLLLAS